jgi:hypothetical protein
MPRVRANDNHPLHKKLEKIWDLMEELGVYFNLPYSNVMNVEVSCGKEIWKLVDLEDGGISISNFPPAFEYKLVREKSDK